LNEELESTADIVKAEPSEAERQAAALLREKVTAIVEAGRERHAQAPVALEIGELTSYADCLIVMNGGSDRQVGAIADNIVTCLKARGEQPLGVEGLKGSTWVLIDADDVIVHVFDRETREHYNLENLWSDAPQIELPEEGAAPSVDSSSFEEAVPPQSP
jgi:ribosome-associated protein